MAIFQLALLDEAKNFLQSLPERAREKILYNIWRVAGGEKNRELFKKVGKFGDMGVSHSLQWNILPLVCFSGY